MFHIWSDVSQAVVQHSHRQESTDRFAVYYQPLTDHRWRERIDCEEMTGWRMMPVNVVEREWEVEWEVEESGVGREEWGYML